MRLFILMLCCVAGLSACAGLPATPSVSERISQEVNIPKDWMMQVAKTAQAQQQTWWQSFNSAELNRLVETALKHNQDLAAAVYTWQKATLAVTSSQLEQYPSLSGSLSSSVSQPIKQSEQQSTQHQAQFSASYQLDLWQKLATNTQVSIWSANASAEDLLATRLSLIGEVVNAWLNLRYYRDQLALNQAHIQYQEHIVSLVQSQVQAGAVSRLDLLNSRQAVSTLNTTRVNLQAQYQQAQNSLSLLLGQAPSQLNLAPASLNEVALPLISPNLPASLLRQRPDLRAAQYRLQADLGNVTLAERDFYPSINLSASLSGSSEVFARILKNPLGALTASLNLPFLQKTKLDTALKSSKLQYQADLASFRQTLYKAFKDVENALITLNSSEQQATLLSQQLNDAKTIENLTQVRYQAGAESLKTLLDAQQSRRTIESSLLENRHTRLSQRVALYLALGGEARDLQAQLMTPSATVVEK